MPAPDWTHYFETIETFLNKAHCEIDHCHSESNKHRKLQVRQYENVQVGQYENADSLVSNLDLSRPRLPFGFSHDNRAT